MNATSQIRRDVDLREQGISEPGAVYRNLAVADLLERIVSRGEAHLARGGAMVANTVPHTGRSPNDKFVVKEPSSEGRIWWGNVNRPFDPERFDALHKKVLAHLNGKDLFVRDCFAGADPEYRLQVRVISESAWHNLFARHMFRRPETADLEGFRPDWVVLHAPHLKADPETDGTRTETFILVHPGKQIVLIGGTRYAGEIKKSIFSVLNDMLPAKGVLPMHCSANVGPEGDVALLYGLSGTGKTTLSADPKRRLIGDDEHGWSDRGVFNFEGGCYAKLIRLDPEAEPAIYATTTQFGTVIENAVMDADSRTLNLDDGEHTENTRAAYDLTQIPNTVPEGAAGHPKNVFFLTCDAFGVLPPISKLTPEQAMYHFLSGYTAKVAGTERGVTEPQATFSACFGAPFLPRHPSVYAEMLGQKIREHGADVWLVNTGWTGGPYGVGNRMSIQHTRALLNAALDGSLKGVEFKTEPFFGLAIPTACPGVPAEVLDPRNTWAQAADYDARAKELAAMFRNNFEAFAGGASAEICAAAPSA